MAPRRLGRAGPLVMPLGYGAFKIGRNEGIKYPQGYELPDEADVAQLLNGLLDLGINYFDTAPAYGWSEERIGRALSSRRGEFALSTKVGETFEEGRSTFDFSRSGVEQSVARSLKRLQTDCVDMVFVHSSGDDLAILQQTDVVETLLRLREAGATQGIGFSGKTVAGAQAALAWADCLMIEYHLNDRSHEVVIAQAAAAGTGIVVKKALASGQLMAGDALRFVLQNPGVSAAVVGTLSLAHMQANVQAIADVA